MKDDWLTIPDAPNYEINSQLICRNKKSGYVVKKQIKSNGAVRYALYVARNKSVMRSPKTFRAQAVAATVKQTYFPIPSIGGKYEINCKGTVRNAKSKIIISTKDGLIDMRIDGKIIRRRISDLLWEVHGVINKKSRSSYPIPVAAENQHGKHFFKTLKDCSLFLEAKVHYSWHTLISRLSRRDGTIFGWKITYLDDDPFYNDYALANVTTPKEVYK